MAEAVLHITHASARKGTRRYYGVTALVSNGFRFALENNESQHLSKYNLNNDNNSTIHGSYYVGVIQEIRFGKSLRVLKLGMLDNRFTVKFDYYNNVA